MIFNFLIVNRKSTFMGNSEEEHTLNQCNSLIQSIDVLILLFSLIVLVEMDGLESKTNVIMLASTNRPDVLDKVILIDIKQIRFSSNKRKEI